MFRLRKSKCYESFKSKLLLLFYLFIWGGEGGGLDFRVFLSNQFPCMTESMAFHVTFAWDKYQISAVIEKLVSNNKVGGIS